MAVKLGVLFVLSLGVMAARADVIANARAAIKQTILNNNALAPKYLRLVFHDCVSPKCDGCIKRDQADNKGLDVPINALEAIFKPNGQATEFSNAMSRADFWALASIVAIEYGVEIGNLEKSPVDPGEPGDFTTQYTMNPIQFTTGRQDCPSSPDSPNKDPLPDAFKTSSQDLYKFFKDVLGFTQIEGATLMSAHAFGQVFKKNSGVDMSWTLDSWRELDVFWIHTLIEPLYDWEQMPDKTWRCIDNSPADPDEAVTAPPVGSLTCGFDLNIDIAVTRDITPASDGTVDCAFKQCPEHAAIAKKLLEMDENSTMWANEFAKVMQKLIDRK